MIERNAGFHRPTGRSGTIRTCIRYVRRFAAVTGLAVWLLIIVVGGGTSWAGPPFRTDDPEPVGLHAGEFYTAVQYEKEQDAASGTAPQFEFNYGILPDVMIHLIAPFAFNKLAGESMRYGYGDTEVGIKYRFVNDEESHFMAGTFPLLELPTGDRDKGLGGGHTQSFLPLWLQKEWGAWTTYGGGGFWRNPGDGNRDYWFFGWEIQRRISASATVGAELFENTKTTENGDSRFGFDAGAIADLSRTHHLLFSLGRDLHGDNRFSTYFAYQYAFGGQLE